MRRHYEVTFVQAYVYIICYIIYIYIYMGACLSPGSQVPKIRKNAILFRDRKFDPYYPHCYSENVREPYYIY